MLNRLRAAILFYTVLPVPSKADLDFRGIAFFAPAVGSLIGLLLGLSQTLLVWYWGNGGQSFHQLFDAVVVVTLWLGLTGGLHMDGAMDAADGLAVTDSQRRLEVMADSRSGAYGVMAAIIIFLLKVVALSQLGNESNSLNSAYLVQWSLITATVWSRWGQLVAIIHDVYLKAAGKGKFHQDVLQPWHSSLVAFLLFLWQLLGGIFLTHDKFSSIQGIESGIYWGISSAGIGMIVSWSARKWFASKFGGQTGDTYGAIVEWSEALILVALVLLFKPSAM